MRHATITATLALAAALAACEDPAPTLAPLPSSRPGLASSLAGPKKLGLEPCTFGHAFTTTSTNPWFPSDVGRQWMYEGDEDGEFIQLTIQVLDEIEVVGGVETRVIEESERADGEIVEISRNYFAENGDGDVCYFGEAVDIYEDGVVVSHEGAWRADAAGNAAGTFMPAHPNAGITFQMEGAPGIAEDRGRIVGIGPITVPAGRFAETIRVREENPLDGGRSIKVYAAGVGLVIDGAVRLVSYLP